jgi:hypothetical protein
LAWRKIQFVLFGVTSFVGQTKQVGQYWLIIMENGTNCVNFVGNCVKFVENVVICLKFVLCFEKFLYVRKFFLPLKWYTDQKLFGDGGGGMSSKIIVSGKKFYPWGLIPGDLSPGNILR